MNAAVDPVNDGHHSHVTVRLVFHGYGIGILLLPMVLRHARKEARKTAGT